MDFKRLEYFVRVAELGSFTRAAAELGVVQSALSRQIGTLEAELKQQLLVRKGHGVTPTMAGMRLLEHGRGILHQVARAEEDLLRVDGALAGRVTVALPPGLGKMLTLPLTREFRRQLPEAALCINEGLSLTVREWLLAGRIDIALFYDPMPSSEFEAAPLAQEALYLISRREVGAPTGPATLNEVAGLPLVLPGRPNSLRLLVESRLAQLGQRPRITLEMDAHAAILDLVADGAGHSVLPRYLLAGHACEGQLAARRIVQPTLHRTLTMATALGRSITLTQQTMLETIREVSARVFASAEAALAG